MEGVFFSCKAKFCLFHDCKPTLLLDSQHPVSMLMKDNYHKGWRLLPSNPVPQAALFFLLASVGPHVLRHQYKK